MNLGKNQIIIDQQAKGKILIEVQNHKDGKALIFSDSIPIEKKSLEQRVIECENRLAILEGI
jgi:hypothetical protein